MVGDPPIILPSSDGGCGALGSPSALPGCCRSCWAQPLRALRHCLPPAALPAARRKGTGRAQRDGGVQKEVEGADPGSAATTPRADGAQEAAHGVQGSERGEHSPPGLVVVAGPLSAVWLGSGQHSPPGISTHKGARRPLGIFSRTPRSRSGYLSVPRARSLNLFGAGGAGRRVCAFPQ